MTTSPIRSAWAGMKEHPLAVVALACMAAAATTWGVVEKLRIEPLKNQLDYVRSQLERSDKRTEELRREAESVKVVPSLGSSETQKWDGQLTGTYILRTWEYLKQWPYDRRETISSVDLKHGGTRVNGTIRQLGEELKEWTFSGYLRREFLTLAYEGMTKGGIGTGTYTMRQDVDFIFWGHGIWSECIGGKAHLVRCPCVMYEKDHADKQKLEKLYGKFLVEKCEPLEPLARIQSLTPMSWKAGVPAILNVQSRSSDGIRLLKCPDKT